MALDGRSLPGFDHDKHDSYVRMGYCDAVHWTKTYCYLPAGHDGDHKAVYLLEDGTMKIYPTWR